MWITSRSSKGPADARRSSSTPAAGCGLHPERPEFLDLGKQHPLPRVLRPDPATIDQTGPTSLELQLPAEIDWFTDLVTPSGRGATVISPETTLSTIRFLSFDRGITAGRAMNHSLIRSPRPRPATFPDPAHYEPTETLRYDAARMRRSPAFPCSPRGRAPLASGGTASGVLGVPAE
jgi:hypothetical protein